MPEPILPKPPRTEEPPFSYRPPKTDEVKRTYLDDLLKQTGSRQLVIDHCVNLAMSKPDVNPGVLNKLQAELEAARAEIKALKDKPSTAGYTPTGAAAEQLDQVSKKKKLSDIASAINYCIKYTKDNLW